MKCKICRGENTFLLLAETPHGSQWWSCRDCRSQSSSFCYQNTQHSYHDAKYVLNSAHELGGMEGVIRGMATNLRLFEKHCTTVPTPTFLDIGSNEGAAMEGMRRRGWQVFGFDVNEHAARPNVIVAPVFRAEIIPMKFGAVMLRGVIENVEEWESLLDETVKCMRNGGVLQVQTPLPVGHYHEFVQCANHLQIFSDTSLQDELEKRNLVILEKLAWGIGQCWIAKKAGRTLIDR